MLFFLLQVLLILAFRSQDKNWGVLEVNHLKGHRKIDSLGEKRTKPTLDQ